MLDLDVLSPHPFVSEAIDSFACHSPGKLTSPGLCIFARAFEMVVDGGKCYRQTHLPTPQLCASTDSTAVMPCRKVNATVAFNSGRFTGPFSHSLSSQYPLTHHRLVPNTLYHPHLVYYGDKYGRVEGAPRVPSAAPLSNLP